MADLSVHAPVRGIEPPNPVELTGTAAAAIMLLLLGDGEAAEILGALAPDDVTNVTKAMFDAASASEAQIEAALAQFIAHSKSVPALSLNATPRITSVVTQALGNIRAGNVLASTAPVTSAAVLDTLRWMEPAAIGEILKTEHPQVGALILAVLAPDIAAAALAAIEDDAQADLLFRAAQLDKVNAAAIDDLEMLLKKHADHKPSAKTRKLNGRGDIAKIVNSMPRNEGERLLKSVKKRDKSLGQAIEDEMFVFDDVLALPAKTLSTILRGVEGNVLTLALKGANAAMIEKALSGMSARAAQTIQDDMAELTQIKRADVDQARKQIIAATRKLADEGSISLSGNADDYV